jgi:hypothetical protein
MSSSVQIIHFITSLYNQYVLTTILIIGLIGNVCNAIIFISLKQFRRYPSTFYIMAESITSEGLLLVGLTPRVVVEIFGVDPAQTLLIWCKLRIPANQWCSLMSLSAVNFTVIDLYLFTHCIPRLRQMSTIRLAKYITGITSIFWFLYNIPFAIFYDTKTVFGCLLTSVEFSRYYSFFHLLIIYGLLPVILSTTFSILAYQNVRRILRHDMTNVRRRFDRQLTAMILARVVFLVTCLVPFILQRFYIINSWTMPSEPLRRAVEQLVAAINLSLSSLNYSVCLYL